MAVTIEFSQNELDRRKNAWNSNLSEIITADGADVPGILIAARKYTGGIVWRAYDMPNYTHPGVCNFKFDSYKFTTVILLQKYIIYAFKSYF